MKLKMIDFAKKLELDEESLSWITAGSFSMRPVYHRQSNKLEVQLHVEKCFRIRYTTGCFPGCALI